MDFEEIWKVRIKFNDGLSEPIYIEKE